MGILKAQVAISLDGFIARKDGEIDWITKEVKESISKVYSSAETLISGTNTYNFIFERWGGWPYKSKKTFVAANTPINTIQEEYLSFITDNPFDVIQGLKKEMESDLVVIGGGKLITSLINTELLDELTIYTIPIMLGEGIPFIGRTIGSEWKILGNQLIGSNVMSIIYRYKEYQSN
ncbi:Pyrimidine deaminase [Porphyromonas macacae]|uniref:Pyrimidine deaminase n=1 Tax=Porphyromonas macacae TaxID=28115 RepID=A0A379EAL8_9PORP|nr:dihydrofolate reductase family protein [Porphyromonas macacae]SUB89569.1 Pyrimidine deaminase [Porphyromonas macacae]